MKKEDKDQLQRWLNNELTPEEAENLQHQLDASPTLREELEQLQLMQAIMQDAVHKTAKDALRPFFADRLMRRINAMTRQDEPDEALLQSLVGLFRPVALAGVLLIMLLTAYNVRFDVFEAEQTTTEAVLGLPPVTLATAYELDYAVVTTEP